MLNVKHKSPIFLSPQQICCMLPSLSHLYITEPTAVSEKQGGRNFKGLKCKLRRKPGTVSIAHSNNGPVKH